MFKFSVEHKGPFRIMSGTEEIFSSSYRWIFHLKKEKIIFMTDIDYTLWVVYYIPERFMSCPFQNNVNRVNFMKDSDHFFVSGKDGKTSFYSISNILEQIDQSMSPVIAPILSSNAVLIGDRYVDSYTRIGESEIDVQIFDTITKQMFVSFRMFGTQIRGCLTVD